MGSRLFAALLIGAAVGAPARAADAPLPLFATLPAPAIAAPRPAGAPDPAAGDSIYHGLSVGTEVFAVGGRGLKGGVGGDVYAGYERLLDGGAVVGLRGTAGYGPAILGRPGLKGFDFGEASVRMAFPTGRFTPFVEAGLLVAKPVTGPGLATHATDGLNDLMNGAGALYAAPRVGAGVAYQLTGNTSVAVGISVGRGPGFAAFP